MKSNLAQKIEAEEFLEQPRHEPDYIEQIPLVEPQIKELPVPKGISKLEIKLMLVIGLVLFGLLLLNVYSDLGLSMTSRKTQDLNNQIQTTEVEVENLEQHVHELSRYDRINDIAEKYGLKLHDKNIRNLSPIE